MHSQNSFISIRSVSRKQSSKIQFQPQLLSTPTTRIRGSWKREEKRTFRPSPALLAATGDADACRTILRVAVQDDLRGLEHHLGHRLLLLLLRPRAGPSGRGHVLHAAGRRGGAAAPPVGGRRGGRPVVLARRLGGGSACRTAPSDLGARVQELLACAGVPAGHPPLLLPDRTRTNASREDGELERSPNAPREFLGFCLSCGRWLGWSARGDWDEVLWERDVWCGYSRRGEER
jgi:hypothetical protein